MTLQKLKQAVKDKESVRAYFVPDLDNSTIRRGDLGIICEIEDNLLFFPDEHKDLQMKLTDPSFVHAPSIGHYVWHRIKTPVAE